MSDMLELSSHLPELEIEAGNVLCEEGGSSGSIWVLVSGSLTVTKRNVEVGTIERPGAVIGEMAVLLGTGNRATVTARVTSRLRMAADGAALLSSDPAITTHVAAVWPSGSTSCRRTWPI